MTAPFKIAVAGLGTIGGGTVKLLLENADLLERRCGRRLELVGLCDIDKGRAAAWPQIPFFTDVLAMASDPGVDAVVELIGGSDGIAKKLCETALASGKHVVTANKAMIAHHGNALIAAAEAKGVQLAFEAAVAGGIPILKALREGLVGNRIDRVYGILNGTCNYILTNMRRHKREFGDILADAQKLGYAEADPTFDIEGVDASHKLSILAAMAFGHEIAFKSVYRQGISGVSLIDIEFAEELGYRIKLLGIARRAENGIEQRVHPCMVPLSNPIAQVEGVFNAVVVDGDYVDTTMYYGRGAGERPTASAVVADLADIAAGRTSPALGIPAAELAPMTVAPMGEHRGPYYVRLMVRDRPGVFAEIAAILRDCEVSMEQVLQRGRSEDEPGPVVLTTHETKEASMKKALEMIAALDAVVEPPSLIRIQSFKA